MAAFATDTVASQCGKKLIECADTTPMLLELPQWRCRQKERTPCRCCYILLPESGGMSGPLACFFQKPVMTPREPLTSISERRSISRFRSSITWAPSCTKKVHNESQYQNMPCHRHGAPQPSWQIHLLCQQECAPTLQDNSGASHPNEGLSELSALA